VILIEFKEDDLTMLRGVLACAGVKDVRYYLNGIHISDRYVESTDGHRFARFKSPSQCGGPLSPKGIIIPTFKIPAPTVQAVIVIGEGCPIEIHLTDKKGQLKIIELSEVNGHFPDLDTVTPRQKTDKSIKNVLINPHLMYGVTKAMGFNTFCPVKIELSQPYRINVLNLSDFIFYIMAAGKDNE